MNNDVLLIKYCLSDLLLGELMAGPACPKDWALLSPTGRRQTRAPRLHITTLLHKPASELELFQVERGMRLLPNIWLYFSMTTRILLGWTFSL